MYVCMCLCVCVCACVFVCLLLCKNCCNKIHLQIPSPCCVYATYATASYKKKRIHNIARALVWKRVCIRRRIACQLWHVKYFKRSHIRTCMYIWICVSAVCQCKYIQMFDICMCAGVNCCTYQRKTIIITTMK